MPDEIQQPATADAESSGVLTPEPATTEAPVQQADSVSADMPPEPTEAPVSSPDPVSLKDDNSVPPSLEASNSAETPSDKQETAQEITPTPTTEISQPAESEVKIPEPIVEKTPDMVMITEVLEKPKVSRVPLDTPPSREATVGQSKSFLKGLLPKLKEKLGSRTEKRLAKIVELAHKKAEKGESIQNDDVEKLLHVSDASATNYLSKLVKRGSLRVSGPKNHSKYIPN